MFFFIFWGTKTRYDDHGVVGDYCPVCDRIRAFNVMDLSTAPHVYYITLGGWNHQARLKRCWGCGTEFYARLKDYDEFIEPGEAQHMSLREITRITNGRLADALEDARREEAQRIEQQPERKMIRDRHDERDRENEKWR
jgi:hypothetical protein